MAFFDRSPRRFLFSYIQERADRSDGTAFGVPNDKAANVNIGVGTIGSTKPVFDFAVVPGPIEDFAQHSGDAVAISRMDIVDPPFRGVRGVVAVHVAHS